MNRMGIEAIYRKPNTGKRHPRHPVYPCLAPLPVNRSNHCAYDSVTAAKQGLERYLANYNQIRPHRSLDRRTPDAFYFGNLPALPKAA